MAGKCSAAYYTDEYHGYGCSVTEGSCMFFYPDSKKCAEIYGEGPDADAYCSEESQEDQGKTSYLMSNLTNVGF